ncbi:MAG: hypothetical protein KJ000_10055 [Pirellulaceae bacterium]|nr:hypothetical protein [Pirellulaceae bacterium]
MPELGPENWEAWSAHLATRKSPRAPWRRIGADGVWPLIWATDDAPVSDETRDLLSLLAIWCESQGKSRRSNVLSRLEGWLADAGTSRSGLELLAWTYVLPSLAGSLSAARWREMLDFLLDAATNWPDLDLHQQPLAHQWLAGELPLTLAYQFPELPACQSLREPASKALSRGLQDLLDGNGLPAAEHVPLVRPLLACWTRCLVLGGNESPPVFDALARTHFDWFVRRALQLTRETGCPVLSRVSSGSDDAELFDVALKLVNDDDDTAIADQILPSRVARRRKNRSRAILAEPSVSSEWGRLAIFRTGWPRKDAQLVVARPGGAIHTELNCGDETVWSGLWTTQIRISGQAIPVPTEWDEICWHADDDVDYQELQADLSGGWTLQRQILLAREDRFLLAADALLGPQGALIEYQAELPLAEGVRFEPMQDTREGQLTGRRCLATVLPLGLPEWRTARADGSLEMADGKLQIRQTATSQRLYIPLFIDLDRKRFRRPLTWRQLTVAERLQIQPPSRVVAYRVQVGDEQWLFYRSLAPAANRTVLGENLANEFLAARFDRDGDTDDLVRIDPE